MPLQNRVTPRGDLIAVPARGALMGNRGRLHDEERRIVRRQLSGYRAWVTCLLAFKGRQRPVMAPGRYTELFFLDEATALAAGHRPCGECRRADYRRFAAAWLAGNPERGVAGPVPIAAIDREMHRDRLAEDGLQRTFSSDAAALPDGVFVAREAEGVPLLIWARALWPWLPDGYGAPEARRAGEVVTVLTPRSTANALAAGYTPSVDASAGRACRSSVSTVTR
jgi:hypothetical protein